MKTKYHVSGPSVRIFDEEDVKLIDHLPVDVYDLIPTKTGLVFTKTVVPICPSKLYGDVESVTSRIITAYEAKQTCMGVLLSGIKGAGKTLTCEHLCQEMLKKGYPIAYIKVPIDPVLLQHFVERLDTPVVFVLDEFEKTYRKTYGSNNNDRDDRPTQSGFLTILNNDKIKHLFVLICNETIGVNEYLLNRPGRIRYHFKYMSMSDEAVRQYCGDKLDNKTYIPSIIKVKGLISNFTFDILKAIVEESNIFKEDPIKNIDALNITRTNTDARYYFHAFELKSGFLTKGSKHMDPYGRRYYLETGCQNFEVDNWADYAKSIIKEYDLPSEYAQIVTNFKYHNYENDAPGMLDQAIGNSAFLPETTNFCCESSDDDEPHLQLFVGDIVYKTDRCIIYKSDHAMVLMRTDNKNLTHHNMSIGDSYSFYS